MVGHEQRVDICNQTFMSSDHWRPQTGTYVSVRGLLSWMHVVTSGKVTLGQVMVKASNGRSAELDVPAIDNSSQCSQQVLSRFATRPGFFFWLRPR